MTKIRIGRPLAFNLVGMSCQLLVIIMVFSGELGSLGLLLVDRLGWTLILIHRREGSLSNFGTWHMKAGCPNSECHATNVRALHTVHIMLTTL